MFHLLRHPIRFFSVVLLAGSLAACQSTPEEEDATTRPADTDSRTPAARDADDGTAEDGVSDGASDARDDVDPGDGTGTGDSGDEDAPIEDASTDFVDPGYDGFSDTPCDTIAPDEALEADSCDGIDDDCDGTVDEGCGCGAPGVERECGPDIAVGACSNGVQACGDDRTWGECEGATWPGVEDVCNTVDDDCDGSINEGLVEKCGCEFTGTTEFSCSRGEMVECPLIGEGVATVDLPAITATCPWDIGDNGEMGDSVIVARAEQTVPLPLPEDIDVCALEISVTSDEFYFDDHVLFLFNDFVLVSDLQFQDYLPERGGLDVYEWSSIRGLNQDTLPEGPRCLPGAVECYFPGTQSAGSVSLSFDEDTNDRLLADATSGRHEFTLVVTGDDNVDIDCQHTGLPLEVRYRYR